MPADESCTVHDARLTRLEEENRHLRAGFDDVRTALQEMSKAVTELAKEAAHREADRETFRRIFKQLETDRDEFTRLWARHDDLVEKMNQAEIRRLQDEREEQRTKDKEFMKAVLTVAAALVAGILSKHFGF